MAKRITIKTNGGIRSGGNNFTVNLTPSENGLEYYEGLLKRKQKADTGLTNLGILVSMTTALNEFISPTQNYIYGLDSAGYIYKGTANSATPLSDFIEKNVPNGSTASSKVSIIQSPQGDVLWTQHLTGTGGVIGRAWTGAHDAGTSATVLTDSSETFTSKVQAGDKIYNLTDASSGTVTSVSGSTITCSGGLSGGSDNQWESGDKFEVFATNWQSITKNTVNSPTGSNATGRSRQMFNFEGNTYIINDNYLDLIDSSLMTGSATGYNDLFIRFHASFIGECAAVNGNKVLVGCNFASRGKLHLWSGYLADWDYKLDIPEEVRSVIAFKEGWIVIGSRGTIYFTNGYSLIILDRLPDISSDNGINTSINGLQIIGDDLFLLVSVGISTANDNERNKSGLWRFAVAKKNWSFYSLPQATGDSISASTPGCLYYDATRPQLYAGYQVNSANSSISNPYFISTFQQISSNNALLYDLVDFSSESNVKRVILEIEPLARYGSITSPNTVVVQAAFSKFDDTPWKYIDTRATSAAANILEVSGGTLRSDTGQAVLPLEGLNAMTMGFISSIANEDSSNEAWTLDQSLNAVTQISTTINFPPLYKSESKTITLSNTSTFEPLIFENIPTQAQYGRKFAFLFHFDPTFNFRIKEIHIDYEETMK